MSCKICNRSACATWMHSAEEQSEWESVWDMDERQLQLEVIDLRREIKDLKQQISIAGLDS